MSQSDFHYTIRPIDHTRDLGAIADLIALCFEQYLDPDGKRYIKVLKKAAERLQTKPTFLRQFSSAPRLMGIVCEDENGTIIGNINLYPNVVEQKRAYLIANVCVHPEKRHQHIARKMMEEVLHISACNGIQSLYLQSREETADSNRMYSDMGFKTDALRTNRVHPVAETTQKRQFTLQLSRCSWQEEHQFRRQLNKYYPACVSWNLNYDPVIFEDSLLHQAMRFILEYQSQTVKISEPFGKIVCQAVWQGMNSYADNLWFIPADDLTVETATEALTLLSERFGRRKTLFISSPKGLLPEAFEAAGFIVQDNLIWMSRSGS